ncbi:MAG: hypothetical protein MHM6MM_005517 [Cercozoa sp. M6MM]
MPDSEPLTWTEIEKYGFDGHTNAASEDPLAPRWEHTPLEYIQQLHNLRKAQFNELKALVRFGVPRHRRPLVYPILCQARQLFPEKQEVPEVTLADIDKDIDRTYPRHPYFRSEAGKKSLRRVLCHFAAARPDIGYCQSLNFVAATLALATNDEATATRVLLSMINGHPDSCVPATYYAKGMTGVIVDCKVLDYLIAKKMPQLARVFESHNIEATFFAVGWFMSLFAVPFDDFDAVLRVYDSVLLEGQKIVFRVALALLKLNERELLLHANDMTQLLAAIQRLGRNVDGETLMHCAFHGIGSLPMRWIRKQRRRVLPGVLRQQEERRTRRAKRTRPDVRD